MNLLADTLNHLSLGLLGPSLGPPAQRLVISYKLSGAESRYQGPKLAVAVSGNDNQVRFSSAEMLFTRQ